ncbi:DUF521 domain-containing protein [archaeon]|nr:MAG: DUF521 domain-containing protein [archaeon]
MELTPDEQATYDGERGPVQQKAMEILVALGKIYGARSLVPVTSVQIAGVSYKNLGMPGKEFIRWWVDQGARVRRLATLNPAGIDRNRWKELGFPEEFSTHQKEIIDDYAMLGIEPTCTCTPYEIGNLPKFGDHIAWSESSAVSFANTYIGARTNREGGPSALAAAIVGKTPCHGYHLDEQRAPGVGYDVTATISSEADAGALGIVAGRDAGSRVPFFSGLPPFETGWYKQLGAAMAAAGSVALYHVDGQTPEARAKTVGPPDETRPVESLEPAYELLNSGGERIDFVSLGCPHASLEEIHRIAEMLRGRNVSVPLWITTSVATAAQADEYGYAAVIEGAGARVVCDTCMVVSPIETFGYETVATNSAKGCYYLQSWCGVETRYGDVRSCIEAACTGRWPQ